MDLQTWITLGTLVIATILFITRWLPLPLTALAIPVILYATGCLRDLEDALSGFGSHAVLAIAAVMIIGGGIRESGVASLIARGLLRIGGRGEFAVVSLLMAATASLAAFMNNTAVVAILLPVGLALCRRSGIATSRVMMPLAFSAVLGGTVTLIGTAPNFLIASYYNYGPLGAASGARIGVFDFATVGIPITVAGVIYMATLGRWLLPAGEAQEGKAGRARPSQVARAYGIFDRLFEMTLVEISGIVGQTVFEADLRKRYGTEVALIRRSGPLGVRWLSPRPEQRLLAGDCLYVAGSDEAAWGLAEGESLQLGLPRPDALKNLTERGMTLAEVALSPHSEALGKSLRDVQFRTRYGLNVIGVWRRGEAVRGALREMVLELGDAILVAGTGRRIRTLMESPDYVVLTDHSEDEDVTRAPLAIAILGVALLPPVLFGFPLPISALGAALLMVGTRCLARRSVLRCVDWSVLCLIAGTIPLGSALEEQGISPLVAGWIGASGEAGGVLLVYALLFVCAALLSVMISNAAAAVIMAPVAAAVAPIIHVDPRQTLLAMAYGCSCNFLLPFAQCNLLVTVAGGYGTRDFVRVGIGMSVVMALTTIGVLSLLG